MTTTYNDLASLRSQKNTEAANLAGKITELKAIETAINNAKNAGNTPSGDLIAAKNQLTNDIIAAKNQLDGAKSNVHGALTDYLPNIPFEYNEGGGGQMLYDYETIWNMNGDFPILMMPLRIETRFLAFQESFDKKLWLRIYPDDIWIKDHEHKITIQEYKAAKTFINSGSTKEAWAVLCNKTSHTRAAWVVKVTQQLLADTTWNRDEDDIINIAKFTSDPHTQPKTNLLPERFRVHIYSRTYQTDPNLIEDYIFVKQHDIKVPYGLPARDELAVSIDPDFQYANAGTTVQAPFSIDANGNIKFEDDLLWIYDFEEAIKKGMADRIELDPTMPDQEYKIIVIGVREGMNITDSTAALKDLFNDHRYTDGLALLKQGQHTKNANNNYAGYATYDLNSDIIYDAEFSGALYTPTTIEKEKSDGQILAEALGFEPEFFDRIYNSDQNDINNFTRVNNFLWETFGGTYLKDQRLVTNRNKIALSRAYVIKYAMSRGRLPGFRIGDVPYGVIPTSDMTGLQTAGSVDDFEIVAMLKSEMEKVKPLYWEIGKRLGKAGSSNGDSAFGSIVAKHAVPQELYQRNVVGPGYIWNEFMASGAIDEAQQWITDKKAEALGIMNDMGMSGSIPPILQKSYLDAHQLINTPLVCEHENDKVLPNIPNTNINYLQWLSQANINELLNHDYTRFGAEAGTPPPNSVLYVLAHNSLLMEYWNVAADLLHYGEQEREIAEMVNMLPNDDETTPPDAQFETMEGFEDFKLKQGDELWTIFGKKISTPDGQEINVGQYIDAGYANELNAYKTLQYTKNDLGAIGELPTKDIGGLVYELIALYTYRFDSWELSMIEWQLGRIRGHASSKYNSYIGAYGWVTDLKPLLGTPTANSEGYILGPSLTHAGAGALIKSAHSASNDPNNNTEVHNISLTSERSRIALNYIEGINNGQEIAVLLGYEFERALNNAIALNKYILPFRNAFPLLSNTNNTSTQESVSPRNVVNGKDLLLAYRDSSNRTNYDYFFGKITTSFTPNSTERGDILKVMKNLDEHLDALADLSESEAAFQIINENIERAGAFAEGISGSKNIPDAQILETPASGQSIVNKVTLHLDDELSDFTTALRWGSSNHSLVKGNVEPSVNNWLIRLLPLPQNITFSVNIFTNNPTKTLFQTYNLSLATLNFSIWDALAISNTELDDDNNELKVRTIFYLSIINRLDDTVTFEWNFDYTAIDANKSISEVYYLLKKTRVLLENSRALKASDYYSSITTKDELEGNALLNIAKHPLYDKAKIDSQFSYMVSQLTGAKAGLGNKSINSYLSTFANLDIGIQRAKGTLLNVKNSSYNGNGTSGIFGSEAENTIKPFWGTIENKDRESKTINKFCVHFKNNLERITINNLNYNFDVFSGNSFSITAWIECEDTSYPDLNYATIFANSNVNDYNQNLIIGINNLGIPFCQYGTYYYPSTANTLRDGRPHHIALVVNKDNDTISLYIDSILTNTFALNDSQFLITQISFDPVDTETYQSIGWTNIYENESSFRGKIADLAIWNNALTDTDIINNRYEIDTQATHLIANWKFKDVMQIPEIVNNGNALYLAAEFDLTIVNSGFVPKNDVERFRFFQRNAKTAVNKLTPLQSVATLPTETNPEKYFELANGEFKKYFGNNFTVLPRFKFSSSTYNSILELIKQTSQQSLLKLSSSSSMNDCYDKAYSLIEGMGRVNKKINNLEMFNNLVYGLSEANPYKITALQFPYLKQSADGINDLWVSIDLSAEASPDEVKKMFSLSRVSIAAHFTASQLSETMESQQFKCGFLIEEWTEIIPDEYVSGGVSFHYDKPLAKPPQALILAVPPYAHQPGSGGNWRRDTLRNLLANTLDLAIMRAVDYEDIATSAHIRAKSVQSLLASTVILNHDKKYQL